MKITNIASWSWAGVILVFMLEVCACRASNVPPCIPTTNWYDAWNCSSGSISNVGVVTPTNIVIRVGDSASASISGTTFNDGSKSRTGHNDCGDSWTDGPYSYGYSATNWFEPEIPTNFPACGTYSYTAEVEGISSDTNCPGTVGPQSPGTFTVQVVNMEAIVDGSGNPISSANSNDTVIVGQPINLSAQTCGGTFSNYEWTVAGSAFSDYIANSQTGKVVTTFPLTNSSVSFYWKDAGAKQVSCQAECGGVTCSTNVSFTVLRPTAHMITKTGTVGVNSAWGDLEIAYGTPTIPGISFSNTISMPSGYYNGGNTNYDTELIQVITSTLRRKQTNDLSWYRLQASGVLDTVYPYPYVNSQNLTSSDSPGESLLSTLETVTISDNFDMAFMFRPSGGQWVPLRHVVWSWGGTATNGPSGWGLQSSSNTNNPSDADLSSHPTWNGNITDYHYQKE